MLRPDPVTPQTTQKTAAANKSAVGSFLQAVDTDRMNPANAKTTSAEAPILLNRQIKSSDYEKTNVRLLQATGVLISAMWLAGAALYIQRTVGWGNISSLMPHELGGFLAGILTPIALFWMIAAFVLRSNDVKMYAEALREEIQAMIFPSEETDRRVNNDIERLIKQTAEMSRATKHILHAIGAARDGLRSEIKALDNSSEQTLDRLSRLGTSMKDRSGETFAITQKLEEAFRQIEARGKITGDIMLRMDKASQQMAVQNDTLQKTSETTEAAVGRLSTMLRERLESLGTLHKETEVALQKASVELASQRELLRAEADGIEAKTYLVADALKKGTDMIYQTTDDALDKAKLIETRLEGKAASLEQILNSAVQSAENIETKTNAAVAQLGNATTHTVGEAQKLESVLKDAIDRLATRTQSAVEEAKNTMADATKALVGDVEHLSGRAEFAIHQAKDVMANATKTLVGDVEHLSGRAEFAVHQAKDAMSDATTRLVTDVDSMSERAKNISAEMLAEVNRKVADTSAAFVYIQKQIQALVTLFDERKDHLDDAGATARATAETLQKTLQLALDKVHGTSASLQDSLANIAKVVEKPIALIESATAAVERKAHDVGELLQTRAGVLVSAAEKIGDNMIAMHDHLHNKGQEVALIAGKIAGHFQIVSSELENQNVLLDTQTKRSLDSLQNLGGLQRNLIADMEQLESQAQIARNQVQSLREIHVNLTEDAGRSETRLGAVSDRLVSIAGNTVEKIKSTLEDMTLLEADYHRLSESGVENIQRVEQAYRHTLGETKTGAEKISAELVAMQAEVQKRILAENEKAAFDYSNLQNTIQSSTAETQTAIRKQLEDIGRMVNTMQNASQNIQQTAELTVAKVSKVENFGEGLQLTLQQIGQAAQEFDSRVAKSGQYISVHMDSLSEKAKNFEDITRNAVQSVIGQGENLETKTKEHVSHLERSFDYASSFTTKLREYLSQLRGDTEGVEKALSSSVNNLLTHGQQIDVSTTRLIDRIAQANQDLMQQGRDWQQGGELMLQRLGAAAQTIGSKASALESAAESAQKQAEAMREQETKLKRDAFFNSTKFVVESLHSMALDFTRLLEGELPDKNWKAYQKGDVGSFTRRLLSARDETTQAKIKTKFKDDVEFRTYVQRYMRQFEEIYDQAAANDHADLLSSIFISSDVGKLYQFLCTVLEREARGNSTASKMAAA